jgi:hypothetical protein
MDELLNKKYKLADQSAATQANLQELLVKINKVRTYWAKAMTVTSGLRTMGDHLRIYKNKGITDPKKIGPSGFSVGPGLDHRSKRR